MLMKMPLFTVFVGNSSLNIQNAQTLRDDLVIPLHPEQLQLGFDFLVPAWRDNDYHCCQVLVGGGETPVQLRKAR